MKLSKKQKTFITIGLIVILSTPLFVIFGSPLVANLFCAANETLPSVCNGLAAPMTWASLLLLPLVIGSVLILVGLLRKK